MSSPAEIIHQLLFDLGLVEESGDWSAFISFFPDQPDQAACVFDTAGRLDGRILSSGENIEHYGIQVQLRGLRYSAVYQKAHDIDVALGAVKRTLVDMSSNGIYRVHNISKSGAINPIGIDEVQGKRRHLFTINFLATITQES